MELVGFKPPSLSLRKLHWREIHATYLRLRSYLLRISGLDDPELGIPTKLDMVGPDRSCSLAQPADFLGPSVKENNL